jgi:hypothetical protein
MHPLFVVADASENDDREGLAHLANESDEGDAIHFGHVEIDDRHVAAVEFEPGGGLETFSEELAGVTFLFEIGDQELGDGRVVIDEEELDGIAGEDFHRLFLIITIMSISTILATPDIGLDFRVFFESPALRCRPWQLRPDHAAAHSSPSEAGTESVAAKAS